MSFFIPHTAFIGVEQESAHCIFPQMQTMATVPIVPIARTTELRKLRCQFVFRVLVIHKNLVKNDDFSVPSFDVFDLITKQENQGCK